MHNAEDWWHLVYNRENANTLVVTSTLSPSLMLHPSFSLASCLHPNGFFPGYFLWGISFFLKVKLMSWCCLSFIYEREEVLPLLSIWPVWFADECPNSRAYLIKTLHPVAGGCRQGWIMHIPPSVFDSVHFMVTVLLPGSPLFCQKHNHKELPKTLSSQRQTTDENGKEELLCEDWVHGCSFFPLLQGIMYLPASWKPGVMML